MAVKVVYTGERSNKRKKYNVSHLDPASLLNVDDVTEQVLGTTSAIEDGSRVTRDETGRVVGQSFAAGEDYVDPDVLADIDARYLSRQTKDRQEAESDGKEYDDSINQKFKAQEENVARLAPQPTVEERAPAKTIHDNIAESQKAAWFIANEKGEAAYTRPDISQAQMKDYLDRFIQSEYNGTITPEEVSQNPKYYKEFGLWLGRELRVLNNGSRDGSAMPDGRRFVTYLEDGTTASERKDTAFVQPEISSIVQGGPGLEQISGFESITKLGKLVDAFAAGNNIWEAKKSTGPRGERQDNFYNMLNSHSKNGLEGNMQEMLDRTHRAYSNMFTGMTQSQAQKWAERIAGEHPGSSVENIKEFIFWMAGNYAAIVEAGQNTDRISDEVSRGLSDSTLLSVLSVMKKQSHRTIEDKDFEALSDPAEKRNWDLMQQGLDVQIGHAIFEAMGLINEQTNQKIQTTMPDGSISTIESDPEKEESLRNYKKWAGSLSRNLVGDIFSFTPQVRDIDQSTGEEILAYDVAGDGRPIYEQGPAQQPGTREFDPFRNVLFEIKESVKDTDKEGNLTGKMTQRVVRLTPNGFKVTELLTPLINLLIPSSRVEPNLTQAKTFLTDEHGQYINFDGNPVNKEAGEQPVPIWDWNAAQIRKFRGTKAYKKQGSTIRQAFNMHIKSLSGGRIAENTLLLVTDILADENAQTILDGPDYIGIDGDGFPTAGPFAGTGRGRGARGNRTRQRVQKENGQVVTDARGNPVMDFFIGDYLKDQKVDDNILWASNNLNKVFYFDYFAGANRREFVKQTLLNYQNDKLSRALLEAGEPRVYSFSPNKQYSLPIGPNTTKNISEIDYFKAQVLRKFGLKGNVWELAPKFNAEALSWKQMRDAGDLVGLARVGEKEGFMSLSAIAEGIKLYEAEIVFNQNKNNPGIKNTGTYISGFLAEADGLTNGMSHSSLQAGDPALAMATLLFVEEQEKRIALYGYDAEQNPDAYIKGYNKSREIADRVLKGEKFGQVISQQTNNSIAAIVQRMDEDGTEKKFIEAIKVLQNTNTKFGRAFTKQPVMIFGYGAGPAMIRQAVREFIYDWFENQEGGYEVMQQMNEISSFNLERDFIVPMGIVMTEALHVEFAKVLELSQTLSKGAVAAVSQGMPLNTFSGQGWAHPFGIIDTDIDAKSNKYYQSSHRIGTDFQPNAVGQILPTSIKADIERKHRVEVNSTTKVFDPAGAFAEGSLKAGTQISVLLNHGNDSYNMGEAMTEVHTMLAQMGKRTGAHHVFDAILATPQDMPMYVKSLNKQFLNINMDNSHVMLVYNTLTYQHDTFGNMLLEPVQVDRNQLSTKVKNQLHKIRDHDPYATKYKRNLKFHEMARDGIKMDENGNVVKTVDRKVNGEMRTFVVPDSTWDKKYDKYAFNWYAGKHELKAQYKDPATGERANHGVPVEDTAQILSDIVKIENRRLKMWKKPFTMLFQFNDGTI